MKRCTSIQMAETLAIGLQNMEKKNNNNKKNTERNLHEIQEQNVCDPHPQPGRGNTKHLEFAGLSVLTLNEDTAGFEKDD